MHVTQIKKELQQYDKKINIGWDILKIGKKLIKKYVREIITQNNLPTVLLKDVCDFLPDSYNQKDTYGYYVGNGPFLCDKSYPTFCLVPDYVSETIIMHKKIPYISCYDNFSCTNEYFLLSSKNDNIKNYWIYYNLITDKNMLKIGFLSKNTEYISKSFIENLEISVPSLEQQKKLEKIFNCLQLLKENIITWISERNELHCKLGLEVL